MNKIDIFLLFISLSIRLYFYFGTSLSDILTTRIEFHTALTSPSHLKEAIYLWKNGIPIYNLNLVPSPTIVYLFSLIPESLFGIFFILVDFLNAFGLYLLSKKWNISYLNKLNPSHSVDSNFVLLL